MAELDPITENVSEVARWLGVSRQAVWKLDHNRERTGMPQRPWQKSVITKWYLEEFDPQRGPRNAGIRSEKVDTAAKAV